ncbi:phosphotransferase [Microbacterium aquimaris]|nr:phosphotransferase [Microbacterium aquimaris]MDZ8275103.1 phosphotransferase [Microbacterium aquimaris]
MDRAVVCHGDACCPNTVIDDDGQVTGHVDLGALGITDRWADIAVPASVTRPTARSGTPPERTPRPREKPLRARDTTQCGVSRDASGFSATGPRATGDDRGGAARGGGRPGRRGAGGTTGAAVKRGRGSG